MNETNVKSKQWIITVVVALIFAAGGFLGGTKYQQSKTPSFAGRMNGQAFGGSGNRFNGSRKGSQAVVGEVVSIDDKSMSVKVMDGSTKIVLLSENSTYSKSDEGTKNDLKTGTQVAVFGTSNSDGSVTAQSVQLNPQLRMFNRDGGAQSPMPANN